MFPARFRPTQVRFVVAVAAIILCAPPQARAAGIDLSAIGKFFAGLFGAREDKPAVAPLDRVVRRGSSFVIAKSDWDTFEFAPVELRQFQDEVVTEGRLAIDENSATPIFSPYSGRVRSILAQAGDEVRRDQPLFTIEAAEMVQAQNDFVAALSALDKARSQQQLAEVNARRQQDLFAGRAAPQRDVDQARADLEAARADFRAATTALEAVENRLRILGKAEPEITAFRQGRRINPEIAINSPIDGTIVQRKVGPGQFVQAGGAEPLFVIDDLNTLWLNALVREDDAGRVRRGATLTFRVMAFPQRRFLARVDFVAATIDPETRRLRVRATVDNSDFSLKQQMFATVSISVGEPTTAPAIPRVAVIHEGPITRVWVADPATLSVELRRVRLGMVRGDRVEVADGLRAGDIVVARGALFVDQMTAALRQ